MALEHRELQFTVAGDLRDQHAAQMLRIARKLQETQVVAFVETHQCDESARPGAP